MAAGSIAAKFLSYPGNAVSSSSIIPRTCASIGLTEGLNCRTVTGGLDVGSPLKTGLGMQDLTYGGNPSVPGVGGGLDGVPDVAYFNSVNPTNTSQMQYNGRVDANITQKDRLTFTIYYVPSTTTDFSPPGSDPGSRRRMVSSRRHIICSRAHLCKRYSCAVIVIFRALKST